MFEQLWYESLCKFIFIEDNERVTTIRPSNQIRVPSILIEEAILVSTVTQKRLQVMLPAEFLHERWNLLPFGLGISLSEKSPVIEIVMLTLPLISVIRGGLGAHEIRPCNMVPIVEIWDRYYLITCLSSHKFSPQILGWLLRLLAVEIRDIVKAGIVGIRRISVCRQTLGWRLRRVHPRLRRVFHCTWGAAVAVIIPNFLDRIKPGSRYCRCRTFSRDTRRHPSRRQTT